jgi:hypothetical protein
MSSSARPTSCWRPEGDAARAREEDMDDFILARALHVLSVLLWIGGVAS